MSQTQTPPSSEQPPNAPETVPSKWEDLGLSPDVVELLYKEGFKAPTPVQLKAIPYALDGIDLMVSAQTGTGKTAAFVIPLIEMIRGREGTFGLILAPSREIAQQTQVVLEKFGAPFGIRSIVLIGGVNMRLDKIALDTYPQVIVATPGRLCDHLDRGNVWLEYLEYVVLDEADRMLDMGFSDQLNRIFQNTPLERQTMMFSATFPPKVQALAQKTLYDPEHIQIGSAVSPTKTVEQRFVFTDEDYKLDELHRLLNEEKGTVFIFVKSKDRASRLWRVLNRRGFNEATVLHSGLEQAQRELALEHFKSGRYRIMVATDVIGRGIHVDNVAHVVNFDLPKDPSDYVHRIGRTGRADQKGKATTLLTSRDRIAIQALERMLGYSIGAPQGNRDQRPQHSNRPRPRSGSGRRPTNSGGRGRR